MVNISQTENIDLIKSIVTNERLWEMAGYTGNKEEFKPNLNNIWLVIKDNETIAGLVELREYTRITFDGHIYIKPSFQNRKLAPLAVLKTIQYLKQNTPIHNVVIPVPMTCIYVMKFLDKCPTKVVGMIENGIIHNNILQDLILYQIKIK